jgi:hypothetical protein
VADDAAGRGKPVRLRCVVDFPPQGTALDESRALDGIDQDGAHRREIDHDAVVANSSTGDIVTAASHGDLQGVIAGETDRRRDIDGATASGDQSRSAVDGSVPDGAGAVVLGMLPRDHITAEPGDVNRGVVHRSSSVRWSHRNIAGRRREGSDLDLAVRNLDFTIDAERGTLRS